MLVVLVPHLISLTLVLALSLVPYMLALGLVHALVSVSDISLHVQRLAKPHVASCTWGMPIRRHGFLSGTTKKFRLWAIVYWLLLDLLLVY